MSALIFINAKKLLALIFLVHEKWVGLNILCELALIFSALVTGPKFISIIIFSSVKQSKNNFLSNKVKNFFP